MAYTNNYGGGQNRGGYPGNRGGYPGGKGGGQDNRQPQQVEIKAEPLQTDYVDAAEQVIKRLDARRAITTSKLRNLFSLISDIYNEENLRTEETLMPESVTALQMARIRFVYEAGREENVKTFVTQAKLLNYLKGIGTDNKRTDLIAFFHYMEALVAYHRFYIGGKEG